MYLDIKEAVCDKIYDTFDTKFLNNQCVHPNSYHHGVRIDQLDVHCNRSTPI